MRGAAAWTALDAGSWELAAGAATKDNCATAPFAATATRSGWGDAADAARASGWAGSGPVDGSASHHCVPENAGWLAFAISANLRARDIFLLPYCLLEGGRSFAACGEGPNAPRFLLP